MPRKKKPKEPSPRRTTLPIPPGYTDLAHIVEQTQLSRGTIRAAILRGELAAFADPSKRILIKIKDADAWIAKRTRLTPMRPTASTAK